MSNRRLPPLAVILALALALRLAAAFGLQGYLDEHAGRQFLIPGDANGYWALGQKIAAGEEFAVHDPPRRILRMPGFPAVLALANGNFLAARIILAILGTAACWLVYCLGKELRDERTGLIAAALCAVSPTMIAFSVVILSETTFAAAMLLSLWGMARFWKRFAEVGGRRSEIRGQRSEVGRQRSEVGGQSTEVRSRKSEVGDREAEVANRKEETASWDSVPSTQYSVLSAKPTKDDATHQSPVTNHQSPLTQNPQSAIPNPQSQNLPLCTGAVVIGITVALASYVRPSWLLFGPAFALAFAGKTRILKGSIAVGLCVVAGIGLALLPWIVRNYHVTNGRFVATTLWVGPSLYDGLNPEASGDSDMTFFQRDNLHSSMSEYEVDRKYRKRAWRFARENPHRVIALVGAKMSRYWKPWPNAPQFRRWWIMAPMAAFFVLMFGAAIYGGWLMRGRADVLLLTLFPILYFAAIHSVFVGSIRYRLPAEYPLAVLTAVGLAAITERLKPGKKGSPDSCAENS